VPPLAAVLGAPAARLGGSAGDLARANARRNPARTATTSAALMVGIALITFVAVIAQGARASLNDAVDEQFLANYAHAGRGGDIGDPVLQAVAKTAGVEVVSGVKDGSGRLFGGSVLVTAPTQPSAMSCASTGRAGDIAARLGRDGAFVEKQYAETHNLNIGSPLRVTTETGQELDVNVKGVFNEPRGGSPFGPVTVSKATFDRSFGTHGNTYTFLSMRGGVTPANTRRLGRALVAFLGVQAQRHPVHGRTARRPGDGNQHDLRAARDLRVREPARHRQHARPHRLRTHA
jgi:putative ABC transport system permease protein